MMKTRETILKPFAKVPGKWYVYYIKGDNAVTEIVDSKAAGIALLKKAGIAIQKLESIPSEKVENANGTQPE